MSFLSLESRVCRGLFVFDRGISRGPHSALPQVSQPELWVRASTVIHEDEAYADPYRPSLDYVCP